MIVDCMTQVWESPEQLGLAGRRAPGARPPAQAQPARPGMPGPAAASVARGPQSRFAAIGEPRPAHRDPLADRLLHADPVEHFESLGPVDVSLVFAFESRLLESRVPNQLVADYVRSHPDRLIGVAGLDPTRPGAAGDLDEAIDRLDMRAAAISPLAQGFHPMDSRVAPFCRRLARRGLPLMVHNGPAQAPQGRLEFGRPDLLDELLREVDGLRLVIAGLGSPWIELTFALMAKHPGVLASLGGLLRSPWRTYNALVLAHEYGVMDRLLFSSDFPYSTPAAAIETLYSLNRMVQGTSLPAIPRELLRGIVERDALALLGLEPPGASGPSAGSGPADQPRKQPARPEPSPPPGRAEQIDLALQEEGRPGGAKPPEPPPAPPTKPAPEQGPASAQLDEQRPETPKDPAAPPAAPDHDDPKSGTGDRDEGTVPSGAGPASGGPGPAAQPPPLDKKPGPEGPA